jgi:hypothetical protein
MRAGPKKSVALWLVILLIAACGQGAQPEATATPAPTPLPAQPTPDAGLSPEEVATLRSLERLDDYPLYTMHYQGSYARANLGPRGSRATATSAMLPVWACSLFAALGDAEGMLYGRNFDWRFSPALLLFTDPPDGYASVSMVDLTYLGFAGEEGMAVDRLPIAQRVGLLNAPYAPFDGMNEHGLAVGVAAVPAGNMEPDPQKPTVGPLGIIREMLDHARTVDEALALMEGYNVEVETEGGPSLHYLVADRTGKALLLEFYAGTLHVLPNESPWHQATNFLRASVPGDAKGLCARYDALSRRLTEGGGRLTVPQALELLSTVSQQNTQWSVVYGLHSGEVQVVMGQAYGHPHTEMLNMVAAPSPASDLTSTD